MAENEENVPARAMTPKEAEATMKELLIDLVWARQFLYDKSHPMHYRTNAKAEVWDKISKVLNIPGEYSYLFSSLYYMN